MLPLPRSPKEIANSPAADTDTDTDTHAEQRSNAVISKAQISPQAQHTTPSTNPHYHLPSTVLSLNISLDQNNLAGQFQCSTLFSVS